MPDIYLYAGEPSPNDIRLADPTVLRDGAPPPSPRRWIFSGLSVAPLDESDDPLRVLATGWQHVAGAVAPTGRWVYARTAVQTADDLALAYAALKEEVVGHKAEVNGLKDEVDFLRADIADLKAEADIR